MSTLSVPIGGKIIELRTASDKPPLKLRVNRFIKTLENLLVLEKSINKIKCNTFMSIEEIKDQTKKK